VPAHSVRYGPSDAAVGHFRRYDGPPLHALLDGTGWRVERFESYGAGLGQALDVVRHTAARRREPPPSMAERSAASGRLHQPGSPAHAAATWLVALPGRAAQHVFRASEVGSGYVVLARAAPSATESTP
jgi:hypothetical protein